MKTIRMTIITILCTIILCNAQSRQERKIEKLNEELENAWPEIKQWKENSLGTLLQPIFKSHAENCGCKRHENGSERNYIPSTLLKNDTEKKLDEVVERVDILGQSILYHIFDELSIKLNLGMVKNMESNILGGNYSSSYEIKRFGNKDKEDLYIKCSGYLAASLKGKINPPYTAISTGLSIDKSKKSAISFSYGSFESPLFAYFSEDLPNSLKYYLDLWKLYEASPSKIGTLKYLKKFDAVLVTHIVDEKLNSKLEAAAALGYEGVIGSVQVKSSANIDISELYENANFETFVFPNSKEFTDFPSIDIITSAFNRLAKPTIVDPASIKNMASETYHEHEILLKNLPKTFSTEGYWELVSEKGYKTNTTSISIRNNDSGGIIFKIKGIPNTEFFDERKYPKGQSILVAYKIRSQKDFNGKRLEFSFERNFQKSDQPIITLNQNKKIRPEIIPDGSKFSLRWKFNLPIEYDQNPINFDLKKELYETNFISGNSSYNTISLVSVVKNESSVNNPYMYEITVESEKKYEFDKHISDFSKLEDSRFSTKIKLTLTESGKELERNIDIILQFPQINEKKINIETKSETNIEEVKSVKKDDD